MSEHAARRESRPKAPTPFFREPGHSMGDEALEFTRWFTKSKYHLMGGFLGEILEPGLDLDSLRARYCRVLRHALRVHQLRGFVTFLLALGVIAAAVSSIANLLQVSASVDILDRAAAISASLAVVLVAARLAIDRYLERCDVSATFLAIELAVVARR